jgi:hypothetical protein
MIPPISKCVGLSYLCREHCQLPSTTTIVMLVAKGDMYGRTLGVLSLATGCGTACILLGDSYRQSCTREGTVGFSLPVLDLTMTA